MSTPRNRTAVPAPSADPVYGVCVDCGAVAWELLKGVSDYCMGCRPSDYRDDDEDDPCAYCDCETDEECCARRTSDPDRG